MYLRVESPQNGQSVAPGALIAWSIEFQVSSGDNQGLSFLAVDFKQNPLNPEKIAIASATGSSAALAGFIAPAGISNPGAGGYYGTPVGTECYADLYCIGGAQNTTGITGANMGTDTTVETGVGQGGYLILASGTFEAPEKLGIYAFQLDNAQANVLSSSQNSPPPWECEQSHTVFDVEAYSIYFEVVCLGDVNGDNKVDMNDLATVLGSYGKCSGDPGYNPDADLDGDGCVNLSDYSLVLANYGLSCVE